MKVVYEDENAELILQNEHQESVYRNTDTGITYTVSWLEYPKPYLVRIVEEDE